MKAHRVVAAWCAIAVLICLGAGSASGGSLLVDDLQVVDEASLCGDVNVGVPTAPTNGLVIWYGFDSSGIVQDGSGNGWTGTVDGATWTTNGVRGGAYSFDGSNDYISAGNVLGILGTGKTYSCWVKPSSVSSARGILNKNPVDPWSGVCVHANPDAGCTIYVKGATESSGGSVPGVFATATWVHVVWVLESNSTVSMYKNGVKQTLNNGGTYNAPSENGEPLVIGKAPTAPGTPRHYHGLIDEVRIYSRPLSAAEVGTLYKSTFMGAGASNGQMRVEVSVEMTGETTIRHLIRQGDVDMGVYTNGP